MSSNDNVLSNLAVAAAALVIAIGVVLAIIFGARLMQDRSASPSVSIQATWLVNAGQQIEAAQRMHRALNSGRVATSLESLLDQGLIAVTPAPPAGAALGDWRLSEDGRISLIELSALSEDDENSIADIVCRRIFEVAGGAEFFVSGAEPVEADLDAIRSVHGCGKKGSGAGRKIWYVHKN
jgi:hypothetical protein